MHTTTIRRKYKRKKVFSKFLQNNFEISTKKLLKLIQKITILNTNTTIHTKFLTEIKIYLCEFIYIV